VKALILYVLFVLIGGAVSVLVGWYVEREISATASLLVFLTMFFLNFVVSWVCVVLVMDGSLKNMKGTQEQLAVERAGRSSISKRG
jgi:hypothetical protein